MTTPPLEDHHLAFLLGLPFHLATMDSTVADAEAVIAARKPAYFVTANVDFITQAYENDALRRILFHADRVICDGMPLVWLSRFFKPELPERVAGSDLVFRLFERGDALGWSVFLLGGKEETLNRTTTELGRRYPKLKVAGTFSPPYAPVSKWPNEAIVEQIQKARPDLLLVAVGCPKQEEWIAEYAAASGTPLSIGIGASLDFIAGAQKRAPRWIQKSGFEWLWRLGSNPKRLAKRYGKDFVYLAKLSLIQWKLTRHRRATPSGVRSSSTGSLKATSTAPKTHVQELRWTGSVERAFLEQSPLPAHYEAPIILDLSEVTFIDSSGLGRLAQIARGAQAAGISFRLRRPSEPVRRLLKQMRLEAQFPILQERGSGWERDRDPAASGAGGHVRTLALEGSLDNQSYTAFLKHLRETIAELTIGDSLILDCSRVSYLDSGGVALLVKAYKEAARRDVRLSVTGLQEQPRLILRVTRLVSLLCPEDDAD